MIFGGTGDLAHRKLLPAFYNLAHEGALPERFNLIAVSRSDIPHGDYRAMASRSSNTGRARQRIRRCSTSCSSRCATCPAPSTTTAVFDRLEQELAECDEDAGIIYNRVFYLSTAPTFFALIVEKLGQHGFDQIEDADVRVVIEKARHAAAEARS